jgi:hypothetical protein
MYRRVLAPVAAPKLNFGIRSRHRLALVTCTFTMLFLLSDLFVMPSVVQTKNVDPMLIGVNCTFDSETGTTMAGLVSQTGVTWIRADVTFQQVFQTTYALASSYRINIIGVLDYWTLNWNGTFTLNDWKNAVTKAQATYPLITVWEIWNEPTLAEYQLGYQDGTPQHYANLLSSAYAILKSGNPKSTILGLGGSILLRSEDLSFAQSVVSLGAPMDAISIHAYPSYLNNGTNWGYYNQSWSNELAQYKEFGKPFWVTESGLPSDQMSEDDQVAFLRNGYQFFQAQGATAFVWFDLIDHVTHDWTADLGLLRLDMTPKPSYYAFADLNKLVPKRRS